MSLANSITAALMSLFLTVGAPPALAQTSDELTTMRTFLQIMTDYFAIIESTHDVASDREKAAILQMQKIQEIYEDRGEKARSIEVLKNVIETSDSPAIRNAAYFLLGDTLKETGRADEAIEYLERGLNENIRAATERTPD